MYLLFVCLMVYLGLINRRNVKLVADYSADYVKYGIKLSYENNINHQKGCTYTTISKTF